MEFDLIRRYFSRPAPTAILGVGDDCALLQPSPGMTLAVTSDTLAVHTHFLPDADPRRLGWKTLAVNLSDLAAMGAEPRWALLALTLPEVDENWLQAFAAGFHACAEEFSVALVGGDTTRGPLSFTVTALGEIPPGEGEEEGQGQGQGQGRALRRDAAQEGDDVWLSGQPGLAALGLWHLQGRIVLPPAWQASCIERLEAPQPRVALGLALRGLAHAAIDVSDGLLADLGHIARRSALDARLFLAQLPRLPDGIPRAPALEALLAGGDDYELAFTAPAPQRAALARLAAELDIPLWRIGTMRAPSASSPQARLFDPEGREVAWEKKGYEHFGKN